MRRFLVLGHTQRSSPPLPLDDPGGAGGRWDVLARCVTNALLVSHGIRLDAEIRLLLVAGPVPRLVRVEGADVRRLNPDERSTIALLSRALEAVDVGGHETRALPGVHVAARGLERALDDLAAEGPLVLLREDAQQRLESWDPPPGPVAFVLSDHREFTHEELAAVRARGPAEATLGPVALQADQCIAVVHNRLDRHGA